MRTKLTRSLIILSAWAMNAACSTPNNSQQSTLVQTVPWQKDSLVMDGNDADWSMPLLNTDEKQGLSYTLSNDQNNLYIIARSQNEATILKILRGGLTVYINSHGVKEEAGAAGISFPTGNRVQKDGKLLNDRPELQQDKYIALRSVQDYSLFGFRDIKTAQNFDYGKVNSEGIELAIGLNSSNALVYEAAIPLASLLNRNEMINLNRKNFAVGFVLESVPGQPGKGGGGGVSIGGGIGLGSFGSGGGIGISIGSGSLANIGGRKQGKPVRIWKEFYFTKEPDSIK